MCTSGDQCCNGNCTPQGVCGPFVCLGDGQSCATPDQCCSGVCAPDANGNLVCNPGCIVDGATCTANGDCCSGFCDPQTLTCGFIEG
jgi:hypothetical protein